MADMNGIVLQWDEPLHGKFGDGVSRPRQGQKTRPYTLLVRQRENRPMRVTLPAPSRQAALRYARNRWPEAEVEVAK